jgi:hypothetical protein
MCVLQNKRNGKSAEVGNVCVKKFLGLNSGKIFDSLKRVRDDIAKALNPDAIDFFFEKGVISGWERKFYIDTWRKRNLSRKQATTRQNINEKVLRAFQSGRVTN